MTSSHSSDNETNPWLQDLPGLQLADLLKITNGNITLVKKLLTGFSRSFADADERILGNLLKGDMEEALREVHSLKGTAGNIGAKSLSFTAAALEQQIRSGNLSINDLFYDFKTKFRQVMSSVQELIREEQKTQNDFQQEKAVDSAIIMKKLKELRSHLLKNDARAIHTFESIENLQVGTSVRVHFFDLKVAISILDAEKALSIVDDIIWKIDVS